jgi:hypothetical protein
MAATLVSKAAETPDGCHEEAPTSDCYATQHNSVFPPTQDKRNRTHTAIGNGAGRAQLGVVLSVPRRAGGLA